LSKHTSASGLSAKIVRSCSLVSISGSWRRTRARLASMAWRICSRLAEGARFRLSASARVARAAAVGQLLAWTSCSPSAKAQACSMDCSGPRQHPAQGQRGEQGGQQLGHQRAQPPKTPKPRA